MSTKCVSRTQSKENREEQPSEWQRRTVKRIAEENIQANRQQVVEILVVQVDRIGSLAQKPSKSVPRTSKELHLLPHFKA